MGVVSSDLLAGILTSFRALYADAFLAAQAPTVYPRIAMEIPSTTLTNTYNWLGTVPVMREWIDQRQSGGLYSNSYSLTNKHYEATIDVDRDTLEDDQLGIIAPRIRQLGMEVPRYIDNCCVSALVNGAVAGNVCYDGLTFYNASHVVGAQAAQTNLFSYTGYDTQAHLQADFAGAKAQMRNVKDDQGRPMNILADLVLVPPAAEQAFAVMLTAAMVPAGALAASMSNIFIGQADMAISPYVTAATWHLLCTKMPVKPLIFQNRKGPEFVSLAKPDDPMVFMSRRFYYGVDTRFAVGYGMWEFAIKVA
jgi:phage major head subunit gpT-like protein